MDRLGKEGNFATWLNSVWLELKESVLIGRHDLLAIVVVCLLDGVDGGITWLQVLILLACGVMVILSTSFKFIVYVLLLLILVILFAIPANQVGTSYLGLYILLQFLVYQNIRKAVLLLQIIILGDVAILLFTESLTGYDFMVTITQTVAPVIIACLFGGMRFKNERQTARIVLSEQAANYRQQEMLAGLLHDSVSGQLNQIIAIAEQASILQKSSALMHVDRLAQDALVNLHFLLRSLSDNNEFIADIDLLKLLNQHKEQLENLKFKVLFRVNCGGSLLRQDTFRVNLIFNELFCNISKYAQPKSVVEIELSDNSKYYLVTVTNKIASVQSCLVQGGIGLNSMTQNVLVLNGKFESCQSGVMWRSKISLPKEHIKNGWLR